MSMISYLIPITVYIVAMALENIQISTEYWYDSEFCCKKNRTNAWILFFLLLIVAALRGSQTGADTDGYREMFDSIVNGTQSVPEYIGQIVDAIKTNTYIDSYMWDLFSKIFSLFTTNSQIWLAFVSFIFLAAANKTIKNHSRDSVISWSYLYFIFIYTFILQGLRQSVAMAFVFLSYKYVKERKLAKFILMIIPAILFHQSAIIFLIVYPLALIRPSKIYFAVIFGVFVTVRLLPSVVVNFFNNITKGSRFEYYTYSDDAGLSWSGFIILLAIFIFCFIFRDKNDETNFENRLLLNMSLCGVIAQSMSSIFPEMFRISYYFNMFNCLLIANTCVSFEENNSSVRYGTLTVFLVYNFVSGVFPYWFFWQQ